MFQIKNTSVKYSGSKNSEKTVQGKFYLFIFISFKNGSLLLPGKQIVMSCDVKRLAMNSVDFSSARRHFPGKKSQFYLFLVTGICCPSAQPKPFYIYLWSFPDDAFNQCTRVKVPIRSQNRSQLRVKKLSRPTPKNGLYRLPFNNGL